MPGAELPAFMQAEYSSLTASGQIGKGQAWWKVVVRPAGHMIIRDVRFHGKPWNSDTEGWEPEGVIWPTWPVRSEDETALATSPLADVQSNWATVSDRLRDSAKWMATVLGAALATVVGASPLAGLSAHHPQGIAIALGLAGVDLARPDPLSGAPGHAATVGVLHRRPVRHPRAQALAEAFEYVAGNRGVSGRPVPALRRAAPDQPAPVHDHRRGDPAGPGSRPCQCA
jgi:hypothetical protein